MEITLIHWVYLAVIAAVLILMICKREVLMPCILGTFLIGLIYTGNPIGGVQTVFNAMIVAGTDLFDIMLIIALMIAMLKALGNMGADEMMVKPAANLVKKPAVAFWVLAGVMYIAATFFWPTPATALVGTILIPVAVKTGLKPMMACMAINLAGHGMALSGDLVLQGAPAISSAAANMPVENVLGYGAIFATVTGLVALCLAFFLNRNDMLCDGDEGSTLVVEKKDFTPPSYAKYFAVGVPIVFLAIIVRMIAGSMMESIAPIYGGDATALLGGTAAIIAVVATAVDCRGESLEKLLIYVREGMLFSIKIFSPVIPIAAFFFLGSPESAIAILGEGAPSLLFDLGTALSQVLPMGPLPLALGIVVIGGITGLDGSGFSGLPLVGALAVSLASPLNLNAAVITGLGQVAAIFVGGGCLSAWAFGAVASAGVTGVSASDLVRKNFIPVMGGLAVSTVLAVVLMSM